MDQCNPLHLSQAHITRLYRIKMSLMREGEPGGGSAPVFVTLYIHIKTTCNTSIEGYPQFYCMQLWIQDIVWCSSLMRLSDRVFLRASDGNAACMSQIRNTQPLQSSLWWDVNDSVLTAVGSPRFTRRDSFINCCMPPDTGPDFYTTQQICDPLWCEAIRQRCTGSPRPC